MTDPGGRAAQRPWDQLSIAGPEGLQDSEDLTPTIADGDPDGDISLWSRMAAGWADLVAVGIVTTAILAGVFLAGYAVGITALPWAVGVASLWWVLCAIVCLRIRRGTPGMLIAGIVFSHEVAGNRIVLTICAAVIVAVFLGIPALPGGKDRTLFSLASGSPLAPV